MKKYYPVDFDEKGNAVLGTPKNKPTSNGFIPTTWTPGGGSGEGIGIKSITISPAITTTPALESLFPIYWEDLTDEQKQNGVVINVSASADPLPDGYTFTLTPTGDAYAGIRGISEAPVMGNNKGEPVSATRSAVPYVENATLIATTSFYQPDKFVEVTLTVSND